MTRELLMYAVAAVAVVMSGVVEIWGPPGSALPMFLGMGGLGLATGQRVASAVAAKKEST